MRILKSNKSKERTHEQFEKDLQELIQKDIRKNDIPKTNYCGLLETKEGMDILRKMSWVEIEELTDYEFYGS
jgi:hypothetical protein